MLESMTARETVTDSGKIRSTMWGNLPQLFHQLHRLPSMMWSGDGQRRGRGCTDGLTFGLQAKGAPRGAGAGLTLSGNDLNVVANADGSIVVNPDDVQVGVITEAQHGDQPLGDGATHAAATGAVNGFMSAADKAKLDGVEADADANLASAQEALTTEDISGDRPSPTPSTTPRRRRRA